ncbi:MAG: leucine-rich repeat domain-containing protein [Muribaculaceae bacterium]|nr:leucine-rich repeat domain-containing protein [Muribaculaceae bacterium]
MKRTVISVAAMICCVAAMYPLSLTITPGELPGLKNRLVSLSDSRLEISGRADVRDLEVLKSVSPDVRDIDLSGLTIVAYTYSEPDRRGRLRYEAGEIPPYMLCGQRLDSFVFPANVSVIGEGCLSLTGVRELTVPATVKTIGDYAFAACPELQSVAIGGDPVLGRGLFKDCVRLDEVTWGGAPDVIPEAMFEGCEVYAGRVPASVEEIGNSAYRNTSLTALNMKNIRRVGDYAFADNPRLADVVYTAGQTPELGVGVFFNDEALSELPAFGELPAMLLAHTGAKLRYTLNAPVIGEGAYANNSELDTVTFGPAVRSIGAHAFRNNHSLNMLDVTRLDDRVIDVASDAFSGLLGDDGRYDIRLNVAKDHVEPWVEHPVWGLFTIGNFDTGVEAPGLQAAEISIQRQGAVITVSANAPIAYVGCWGVDGMLLSEIAPATEIATIENLPDDGVVVVKAIAGDTTRILKLR